MGSRGRSIRLRIYFLVAIPLITMIGLLSYVVTTTAHNASNLDRAPSLINATSLPAATFVNYLQNERLAAVVYVFVPTPANLAAYQTATKATDAAEPAFLKAMNSPQTRSSADATSLAGIRNVVNGLQQLPALRKAVEARMLGPGKPMTALDALGAYSKGIQNEPTLFLDESASMTNATAASQSLGLIATVSAREALSQEYALLSGMLAANKASQADRAAFAQMAAVRGGDTIDAEAIFNQANLSVYNAALAGTAQMQQQLTVIEQEIASGVPVNELGITAQQWQTLATTLLQDSFTGGVNDAAAQLVVDRQLAHAARQRLIYAGSGAAAGLLLTFILTSILGRSLIKRLRGLETNARTLAEKQLPDVVGRLRRGEDVDIATEAPPLRVGSDEIGRVGQAFDLVRQTAIRSAVEEARLRRGINDVFRSLARRSQSLLHRQLTLLDQMERRASDPEALDDLFRLDHLTTRMRRHAEGLVILSGAPAGRGWSSPVRMVDVMRGAIAEVEDYARVSVATRSQAALSGSAVADVIHLLAELIENATTLSPPYTSVRVSGDTVANGFAIEVEDRGLGMSTQRLNELNERLASPPEFNPSDSEQLGLFVVSQLARRHGIKVTLKSSPYGGSEAVVLIPRHLVVTEDAFRASLPGASADVGALTAGQPGSNGHHLPELDDFPQLDGAPSGFGNGFANGGPGGGRPGLGQPADSPGAAGSGPRISGALRRAQGSIPEGQLRGGHHAARRGNSGTSGTRPGAPGRFEPGNPPGDLPHRTKGGNGRTRAGAQPQAFDGFATPGGEPAAASGAPFGPAPVPDPGSAQFPGWPGGGGTRLGTGPAASAPGGGFPGEAARGEAGRQSLPPWELSADQMTAADGPPAPPGGTPSPAGSGPAPVIPAAGDATPDDDFKGLPRRVKQANIAPQLRGDPAVRSQPPAGPGTASTGTASTGTGSALGSGSSTGSFGQEDQGNGAGGSGGPSPAEIRATMSALQRGWQRGRSHAAEAAANAPGGSKPPWELDDKSEERADGA